MTAVDTASPLRLDRYLALLAILLALVLGLLVIGERQQPVPRVPAIEGAVPPPPTATVAARDALVAEQVQLAERLEATEAALGRAEAEIDRLREENRVLNERLLGEGGALDELAHRLAAVEAERNRLALKVEALTATRERLEAELAQLAGRRIAPAGPLVAAEPRLNEPATEDAPAAAAPPPLTTTPREPATASRDPAAVMTAQRRGLQAALEDMVREQRAEESASGAEDAVAAADPATTTEPRTAGEPSRLITFNGNGGSVDDGIRAYRDGDYVTAERVWGALAVGGDPRAQFHFGALMYEGRTAAPDLVMAHVWLSRAVDGGHLPAIELRRRVRAAMSETQYQEALAIQTSS